MSSKDKKKKGKFNSWHSEVLLWFQLFLEIDFISGIIGCQMVSDSVISEKKRVYVWALCSHIQGGIG